MNVQISPLCDMLFLMSKIKTYFTTTDYIRCTGEEILIRKCDVSTDLSKVDVLSTLDQEKVVYKGVKGYD
jgi:hypothetical protein